MEHRPARTRVSPSGSHNTLITARTLQRGRLLRKFFYDITQLGFGNVWQLDGVQVKASASKCDGRR